MQSRAAVGPAGLGRGKHSALRLSGCLVIVHPPRIGEPRRFCAHGGTSVCFAVQANRRLEQHARSELRLGSAIAVQTYRSNHFHTMFWMVFESNEG